MARKEKKPKSKRAKIMIKILVIAAAVILLFFCFVPVMNDAAVNGHLKKIKKVQPIAYPESSQIAPVTQDGTVTFITDREFKVLQLTDIHLSGGVFVQSLDNKALVAVETMIRGACPDLVIITGDLCYATPLSLSLDNSRAYKMLGELMERLGVYWTLSMGNHDSEVYNIKSKKGLVEMMTEEGKYPHCLVTSNYPDVQGVANQFINVKNSKNIITQSMVIFDSNTYKKGGYDIIYDNQIAWYEQGIGTFSEQNKLVLATLSEDDLAAPKSTYETVKSIAFFHIPLEEYKHAHDGYINNGKVDSDEIKLLYGKIDEKICRGYADNLLFEKMLELGSTKGIFVGHDHVNNTCYEYKGIKLAYSYSIDYLAYRKLKKTDEYRGGTVIVTKADATFTNELLAYSTLK